MALKVTQTPLGLIVDDLPDTLTGGACCVPIGAKKVAVFVVPTPGLVCPVLLFQSPVENDTSVYPQPLGSIITPPGIAVRKFFDLRDDTRSVWWQPYGWYYDQTQGGTWTAGVPDAVGTMAWPRGLGSPVSVDILPLGQ